MSGLCLPTLLKWVYAFKFVFTSGFFNMEMYNFQSKSLGIAFLNLVNFSILLSNFFAKFNVGICI